MEESHHELAVGDELEEVADGALEILKDVGGIGGIVLGIAERVDGGGARGDILVSYSLVELGDDHLWVLAPSVNKSSSNHRKYSIIKGNSR